MNKIKNIPTHDPYTGELNPFYEELTGEKNPLSLVNDDKLLNISLLIYETTIECYKKQLNPRRQILRIKKIIEDYGNNIK